MLARPMEVRPFKHVVHALCLMIHTGAATCSGEGGSGGWLCQHRYAAIAGMVRFRNAVGSAAITDWVSPQSQQIAFGRGT
jgi:hypothetical protein